MDLPTGTSISVGRKLTEKETGRYKPHTVVLVKGQSLLDGALQHCGSPDYAMLIALMNSLTLDFVATEDTPILAPQGDTRATALLASHGVTPVTGDLDNAAPDTYYGIGNRPVGGLPVTAERIVSDIVRAMILQQAAQSALASLRREESE